jgi:hypothetical protein
MSPPWHKQAQKLRHQGASLREIGEAVEVSPQAVSLALDPDKQAARRKYVKAWKRKKYKDPKFRKRQQKLDRDSKRRARAG